MDHHNLVIGTSTGKIMAMPLCSLCEGDMGGTGSVYGIAVPPTMSAKEFQLLATSTVSLHSHRDERVVGLIHVPLPENTILMGSTLNVMQSVSASLAGGSLTALHEAGLQDSLISPPHQQSQSKYHSLLVSAGKGHRDYQLDTDSHISEDSFALRERAEAFQVMVWGYHNTSAS